jgi:hypothetical protein
MPPRPRLLTRQQYLDADDTTQFETIRQKWAKLNFTLLEEAEGAVNDLKTGGSSQRVSPLVISAGISFDKLYGKRDAAPKALAFPAPLVEMVRKGLLLANSPVGSMPASTAAIDPTPQPPLSPVMSPTIAQKSPRPKEPVKHFPTVPKDYPINLKDVHPSLRPAAKVMPKFPMKGGIV